MVSRREILSNAVDDCLKEIYSYVQPSVTWDDFMKQCEEYSKKYIQWEQYNRAKHSKDKSWDEWQQIKPEWKDKSITECIGPRPFEFYYLPKDILKDIADSYVSAYRIDHQDELLNTIQILKNYCREPIVDKWIEKEEGERGYRGYDHPDNLEKEIFKIIDSNIPLYQPPKKLVSGLQNKFFEFLDMAGEFYNWNGELNSFNMSVYLGPSPHSVKETVIDNWKKYRNTDININEEQIKINYYGEEYSDNE